MRLVKNFLLLAVLGLFSDAASIKQYDTGAQISGDGASARVPRISYRDVSNSTTSADTQAGQPPILPRCRAEELSPGSAAWILLVLGTASVVQLPGSLILPFHQGLYRLAPEVGVLEACGIIVLVLRGVFTFKQKFRTSVKATFALRRALGEGDRWWMDDFEGVAYPYSTTAEIRREPFTSREELKDVAISKRCTPMEAFCKLDPFLDPLSRFSPGRFLALALTILALVKAFVVTGTVRTTALAACYAISFFPIEILAWTLLDFRPRPSKGELESDAIEIAKLMSLLNPYRKYKFNNHTRSLPILTEHWSGFWFFGFTCVELLLVIGMIFWPLSVIISMFEFLVWERGRWIFWCFALVTWFIAIAVGIMAVFLVSFVVDILGRQKWKIVKWTATQFEGVSFATVYVGLKMFVILREYLLRYTGEGTRTPDWLDWLN